MVRIARENTLRIIPAESLEIILTVGDYHLIRESIPTERRGSYLELIMDGQNGLGYLTGSKAK